jgi:hypothetical protein
MICLQEERFAFQMSEPSLCLSTRDGYRLALNTGITEYSYTVLRLVHLIET